MPLGNPEEQSPQTISDTVTTITLSHGLMSLSVQNIGNNDIVFGKASTLTFARGQKIFSAGGEKSWENLGAGWKISFRCDTGKTSELRITYYQ